MLTELIGPGSRFWSAADLRAAARAFFSGRNAVAVNGDLRVWVTRVLHRIMTGLELSEAEGADFMALQFRVLVAMSVPESALCFPPLRAALRVDECLRQKSKWLKRYRKALKERLPLLRTAPQGGLSDEQLTQLASAVMDALMFAGGQSVPTVLAFAMALPYSAWGQANLPAGFSLVDPRTHGSYVWEVIRRFAPVSGFAYTERSFGNAPARRVWLNLQMAQLDESVWGDDATAFRPRDEGFYEQHSVGFGEPAVAPKIGSPNAHSCPAQERACPHRTPPALPA